MRKNQAGEDHSAHLDALFEAIVELQDKRECQRFLNDLCTPVEIRALSDRWRVANMLEAGQDSYRDITAKTGVSVTTVGRVARFMSHGYGGYRLMLDRLNKK